MIEQVVTDYLREDGALALCLARYGGVPAVFCQKAPDDKDPAWEQGRQFGRVVYALDLAGDPKRARSGVLAADIFCLPPQAPEDLEPLLRQRLDGRFFFGEDGVLSAAWRDTRCFTEPAAKVDGATVTFDLLQYPAQAIPEPDPVGVLGRYVQGMYPGAVVIGQGRPEGPVIAPSQEKPVFYCFLSGLSPCRDIPDTFSCLWRTASLEMHIAAGDRQAELRMADRLAVDLARRGRLLFPDKGPLLLGPPALHPSTLPQQAPYLTIEGSFGILRNNTPAAALEHITVADGIGKER